MENRKKTLLKPEKDTYPFLQHLVLRIKAQEDDISVLKKILSSLVNLYLNAPVVILLDNNFRSRKLRSIKKFLNTQNYSLHRLIHQTTVKPEKVYLIPAESHVDLHKSVLKLTVSPSIFPEGKISVIEVNNGNISFHPASYSQLEESKFKLRNLKLCILKINKSQTSHLEHPSEKSASIGMQPNLISGFILEKIIDSTNLIMVGISENGTIQLFNRAAEDIWGFSKKEVIGKRWKDYILPQNSTKANNKFNQKSFQSTIRTKNGIEKIVHWQIDKVDLGGAHQGTLALGMDISGLIKHIHKLNEGYEKFKTLEENTLVGIVRKSPYGKYLSANQTFCELTGYSLNEIKNLTLDVLTYHKDLDKERALIDQLLKGEIGSYKIEKRYITKSRKIIWVEINATPVRNYNGEIEYIIVIVDNIDQRKRAEFALKKNELKYKILSDNPTIGFAFSDENGILIESNMAFDKMLGYQKNELLGRHFRDFTYHEDAKREEALLEKIFKGEINEYQLEKRYLKKNQEPIWVDLNLSTVRNEKNEVQYFICIIQNIDTRKKAEDALIQSEEQYRFLANTVPQIFWSANKNGIINFFNKKWVEFTGIPEEEAVSKGWTPALHPDDAVSMEKEWFEAIKQGTTYEKELRLMNKEGKFKWFLSKATPLKNSQGECIKWFGTFVDIHDLKIAIQNLEDAYKDLKKANIDLDNFIYSASHDLKAPVSNIEGLVTYLDQLLKESYLQNDTNEEIESLISLIYQSIKKFKKTIEDLSDVAKTQSSGKSEDLSLINIQDAMEEAKITLMNDLNNSRCSIRYQFNAPEIRFSIKDFRSIIYNLLSNAIKYRSRKRTCKICINTYHQEDALVMEVKDNGIGIDPKNQERMFQIFRRVHNQKLDIEGSGVGLYILKRIMDNNNGSIRVISEVDKGSTFILTFPHQKKNNL